MDLTKFVLFTFAGSAIWSVALTLLGYFLGDAWNEMADQFSNVLSITAIAILVTITTVLVFKYYKKRKSERKRMDRV
jgi:membrane protein DedA with SNARE-associated domain